MIIKTILFGNKAKTSEFSTYSVHFTVYFNVCMFEFKVNK